MFLISSLLYIASYREVPFRQTFCKVLDNTENEA